MTAGADYEELLRARAELAAIPVADIVANHAIGLQQLAVIHLIPDPGPDGSPTEPRLAEAGPRHRRPGRAGRRASATASPRTTRRSARR